MGRTKGYGCRCDYSGQENEPLDPGERRVGTEIEIVIENCIVLKIDLTSQTSLTQDQVNQVVNSSGNQQLRLYVLSLPILPL